MRFFADLAIGWAQAWLDRFSRRHKLVPVTARALADGFKGKRLLLHVGCGHATKAEIQQGFQGDEWSELRLDANPKVDPDIVGSMTDLSMLPDRIVDAVYSSHGIEHLYWHEVLPAMREFRRVLVDEGVLVLTCPDLQAIAKLLADDKVFEAAYESPSGPVSPFDMVYGHRPFLAAGSHWMAHRCGFTLSTLLLALREAGFVSIAGFRREQLFDLWIVACKEPRTASEMENLVVRYLPEKNQE